MAIDPELISYQYVQTNLEKCGWSCRIEPGNQRGYDITATKNGIERKIEVKSRTYAELSPGGSIQQTTRDRRYFRFSDVQVNTADYFICFFLGPRKKLAIVVPKEKYEILRSRRANENILAFSPTRRFVKPGGKKIDISEYIEGWNLVK